MPNDRVGAASAESILPGAGAYLMAAAMIVSVFGCNSGIILSGARCYYAMALDNLFFKAAGRLNKRNVPGWGLILQGVWASILVLPRTVSDKDGQTIYGNLYGDLINYIISAALIFYILTIAGVFRLRRMRPDAERPYRAWGYPFLPALYIVGATVILIVLFIYQPKTSLPGLAIVAAGVPVYLFWKGKISNESI